MADLSQTAANVAIKAADATLSKVQAGEAVTQGMPVYLKTSDGKYYKTDADASSDTAVAAGVALTAASTDGFMVICTAGDMDLGATLTVGETYVASDTAGGVAPIGDLATGDYVTHLGVASATDTIKIDINVTGVQKP